LAEKDALLFPEQSGQSAALFLYPELALCYLGHRMTIEIPDRDLASISLNRVEARRELAIGLYTGRRVTLGQAAQVAGVPYVLFLRELGRRQIPLNYSLEDALHDMRVVDELSAPSQQ
jgi:predicted HTH domain antitoxin